MIEHKISLSPALKLSSAGQISAPQSLRSFVRSARTNLNSRSCAVFAGLMLAYFLSSKSYQAFVAPYRDLWAADFKLIAILLIISPAFLLAVREVFGDKAGPVSRRNGLLALLSVRCVITGILRRFRSMIYGRFFGPESG